MTTWRPTTLQLVERNCPKAVEFVEQGKPRDPAPFAVGIAAHACIEAVVRETSERQTQLDQGDVDAVTLRAASGLIANGRIYDGEREPPIPPDAAMAGRQIALDWLARWWPEPGAYAELGIAVDERFRLCGYDDTKARLRTILDYAHVEEHGDEESSVKALVIYDWKSSWATNESELETTQRKVQIVLGWVAFATAGIQKIVARVVNLRTWRTYEREVWLSEDGETLRTMREELTATMDALDAQAVGGLRPASPGACCLRCPYVLACDWAADYAEDSGLPGTAEKRAVAYAATHARLTALGDQVRVDTEEGPIAVPGGVVGFVGQLQRQPVPEAYAEIAERWPGDVRGLLKALKLRTGNVQDVAVQLFPAKGLPKDEARQNMESRRTWLAGMLDEVQRAQFGVHKPQEEEAEG